VRVNGEELAGEDHMSVRDRFLQRGLASTFDGWYPDDSVKTGGVRAVDRTSGPG
jgi:hypothetical protein